MNDHVDYSGRDDDATGPDSRTGAGEARTDLRPREPIAKGLNRNALTVAAVLMGITVLTVIVMFQPSRSTTLPTAASTEAPAPSQPTFLDRPLPRPVVPVDSSGTLIPPVLAGPRQQPPSASSSDGRDGSSYTPSSSAPYAVSPESTDALSRARALSMAREQAFQSALAGGVLVGGSQAEQRRLAVSGEASSPDSADDRVQRATQSPSPTFAEPIAAPAQALSRSPAAVPASASAHSFVARLERPASPYVLSAGTVVPGVLITGVVSDLPGDVVAQVSRDVYDSRTERLLLIPKGSKLVGTYDNRIVASQSRLLIAWTRLILPDGRSLMLPGLPLKDLSGQTGAQDKVDNHRRRVFGSAALLSLIGAAVQLSQPQQSSVLTPPSTGQILAGAAGQELAQVATEILRRGMDQPPTITIRPATPFNVFLNGDLVFDGPYIATPLTAMR